MMIAGEDTVLAKREYQVPKRTILSLRDLENYTKSKAFVELTGFISELSDSVRGQTLRAEVHESKVFVFSNGKHEFA
jgi:hypothetical protein